MNIGEHMKSLITMIIMIAAASASLPNSKCQELPRGKVEALKDEATYEFLPLVTVIALVDEVEIEGGE
jgi:hypothetical protein